MQPSFKNSTQNAPTFTACILKSDTPSQHFNSPRAFGTSLIGASIICIIHIIFYAVLLLPNAMD